MANSLLITASAVAVAALACARSPAHPCRSDVDCAVGWVCQYNFCTNNDPGDAGPRDVSSRDSAIDTPAPDAPATTPDAPGAPDAPGTPDAPPQDVRTDAPVVRDSPWNYMFVTSMTFMPDFGSLEAADNACDSIAASAGLPGRYRAWLSTSTVDARDRLADTRGWVRVDGAPFADRPADIATGYIFNAPYVDELGRALPVDTGQTAVMTGTFRGGIKDLFGHCQDWKGSSGSYQAGTYAATTRIWTEHTSVRCSQPSRLYCFGIDKRVSLIPPPVSQRRAFLSNSSFALGGGLAAADALCARDAVVAGLPPNFKALLPTSQASAASRFPGLYLDRLGATRRHRSQRRGGRFVQEPTACAAQCHQSRGLRVAPQCPDRFQGPAGGSLRGGDLR
jgi:hypothetical protein